jgi:hypothetical protein
LGRATAGTAAIAHVIGPGTRLHRPIEMVYRSNRRRARHEFWDRTMTTDSLAEAMLSDRDLVLRFESLGDSCELGLVQRQVGAEPLGLFRFAGAPLRHLIRAMEARFDCIADPANICVQIENGEYMIKLTKYDFIYHSHVKIGEADPDILCRQQTRTVGFLAAKLIADLESAEKIMVFRQNEPLAANDLLDFRAALGAYGPATLLWVQETRPGHPPGTVLAVDDTLMIGYVTRLASRYNAPDLDLQSWLTVLRRACAMRPDRQAVLRPSASPLSDFGQDGGPSPARRTDIVFGDEGNAGACVGYGWSGPERGYTWSIDESSVLTIDHPGAAGSYMLEMEVVPYIAAPAVAAQPMDVLINGQLIQSYDQLERGNVRCIVPGHVLTGQGPVEIVLHHPAAISPRMAAGENDDRRLAVAFYRLSLICASRDPQR